MTTTTTTTTSTIPLRPVIRTRRDDARTFRPTLRSEWIKLTTIRSNRLILGLSVVIGVLLSWIIATFVHTDPNTHEVFTVAQTFIFSTWLSAVLSAITGTLLFTSEVEHGTLPGAMSAQPARWIIAAAKATMAAGFGLVMGILAMIAGFAGAVLGGLDAGDTSTMPTVVLGGLLVTTLSAVLGLGVGMIIRHSAAAVATVLVWALVIENLLRGFLPPTTSRFLPFSAVNRLLGIRSAGDTDATVAAALSRPLAALFFVGYSLAALAIGTVLLSRRDPK